MSHLSSKQGNCIQNCFDCNKRHTIICSGNAPLKVKWNHAVITVNGFFFRQNVSLTRERHFTEKFIRGICNSLSSRLVIESTQIRPGVNFTNVLRASFAPTVLHMYSTNLKCKHTKSCVHNLHVRMLKLHLEHWWNWHQGSFLPTFYCRSQFYLTAFFVNGRFFSIFFQLSLNVCSIRTYCLYFKMAKPNSENCKNEEIKVW